MMSWKVKFPEHPNRNSRPLEPPTCFQDFILGETWATSKKLQITVISGNQLPTSKRDMIDPYVVIEVLTPTQPEFETAEFKTKTIKVSFGVMNYSL